MSISKIIHIFVSLLRVNSIQTKNTAGAGTPAIFSLVLQEMSVMQGVVYDMRFDFSDWHVFPDNIPVHARPGDVADK